MHTATAEPVQVYEGDGIRPPKKKIVRPPKPFENEGKFRITINDITFVITYVVKEIVTHVLKEKKHGGVVTSQSIAVNGCGFGGVFNSSDLHLKEKVTIRPVMVGKSQVQTYKWDLSVDMIKRLMLERFGDHLAKQAAHKKKFYKKRTW